MQFLDALIAFPVIVLYLVVIAALGQGDLVVILAIYYNGCARYSPAGSQSNAGY